MDRVPKFTEYKNLDMHSYKKDIPQSLLFLITLLVSKDEEANEIIVNSIMPRYYVRVLQK